MNSESSHSRNKAMAWAGYGIIVLFLLLFLSKTIIPSDAGGWSNPPIYDYILLLGVGVCISILGIDYSYFAWTRSAKDYVAWFLAQSPLKIESQVQAMSNDPGLPFWLARLIAPIIALFGIAIIGYISYSIVSFFVM